MFLHQCSVYFYGIHVSSFSKCVPQVCMYFVVCTFIYDIHFNASTVHYCRYQWFWRPDVWNRKFSIGKIVFWLKLFLSALLKKVTCIFLKSVWKADFLKPHSTYSKILLERTMNLFGNRIKKSKWKTLRKISKNGTTTGRHCRLLFLVKVSELGLRFQWHCRPTVAARPKWTSVNDLLPVHDFDTGKQSACWFLSKQHQRQGIQSVGRSLLVS